MDLPSWRKGASKCSMAPCEKLSRSDPERSRVHMIVSQTFPDTPEEILRHVIVKPGDVASPKR